MTRGRVASVTPENGPAFRGRLKLFSLSDDKSGRIRNDCGENHANMESAESFQGISSAGLARFGCEGSSEFSYQKDYARRTCRQTVSCVYI